MEKNIILKLNKKSIKEKAQINQYSLEQKSLLLSFCTSVLSQLNKSNKAHRKEEFNVFDFDSIGRNERFVSNA